MKMEKIIKLYLELIKNPFIELPYKNLNNYYKSIGLDRESTGFIKILETNVKLTNHSEEGKSRSND
jgi:hypothetical protein